MMVTGGPGGEGGGRTPVTPQMALRVATLGGIALVLFAIVFFRLWFLQVLSGDQYVSQANDNRVREVRVPAPRGDITDRNGTVLVTNRQATVVQIEPGKLPEGHAELKALYARLGKVLRMKPIDISREVNKQRRALPYANVTVKVDAPRAVLNYLQERKRDFPAVTVIDQNLRRYPHTTLAVQLLEPVGQITESQLKEKC